MGVAYRSSMLAYLVMELTMRRFILVDLNDQFSMINMINSV